MKVVFQRCHLFDNIPDPVCRGFTQAGIPKENISFVKDTFTFRAPYSPTKFLSTFRDYYGPTMNAFEAAEKNGKVSDLQRELEELFNSQNQNGNGATSIPVTFLRVTVVR